MPPLKRRSVGARSTAWISWSLSTVSAAMPSSARASGESRTVLVPRAMIAPPRLRSFGTIVGPARARQREEALALGEGRLGVGIGIEKDVAMVECRAQARRPRAQHAVAEHVAAHVADAGHGEGVARHVAAVELAEVQRDALPGAARRDAHLLVVVALRAAGREGVAEPEAVLGGDGVGDVGEGRRALVGGDDEIGIGAVVADEVGGRDDAVADQVVGEVQQAADQRAIGVDDARRASRCPSR